MRIEIGSKKIKNRAQGFKYLKRINYFYINYVVSVGNDTPQYKRKKKKERVWCRRTDLDLPELKNPLKR